MTTIPDATRSAILRAAEWYEKGSTHRARDAGYSIPNVPGGSAHHKRVKELVHAIIEADRISLRRDSSSSSEEPPQKRQTEHAKWPVALHRHWVALSACNKLENGTLFLRAKAKALRGLLIEDQGFMKLPRCANELIFSFLKVQDLCTLSPCSSELNYVVQNASRVWQKLGKDFGLPDDYFPQGDFSKRRCVQSLQSIVWANRELDKCIAQEFSFSSTQVFSFSALIQSAGHELRCSIEDPLERFTKHTRPTMLDTRSLRAGRVFFDLNACLFSRGNNDDPRGLVNLLWTCGLPKHRQVLGTLMEHFSRSRCTFRAQQIYFEGQFEFTPAQTASWLRAFEWVANRIPQWSYDSEDDAGDYDPFRVLQYELFSKEPLFTPSDRQIIEPLLLQIIQRGGARPKDLLGYCYTRLPLNFLKPLLDAMKDKSQISQYVYDFLSRCFRKPDGFIYHHEPEEVLEAILRFKGTYGWNKKHLGDRVRPNPLAPGNFQFTWGPWVYEVAKLQFAPLMSLLCELSVPYLSLTWDNKEEHSLTIALQNRAPLEVIDSMCKCGIRPSEGTLAQIDSYSDDPEVRNQLRTILRPR